MCAVYYTSGTTGEPKGVACTHEGWAARMAWMQRGHGLGPGEAVLHKTTLTFDDSAVEVFWPLAVGGRVAMIGPGDHRDPRAIIEAAVAHEVVHLQFVPSVLEQFLDTLTSADVDRLAALRTVLSSGEALRPELVRRFRDRFGDAVLLENTWGATEASIDSTRHVCVAADGAAEGGAVCLGLPIDGNEIHVLGSDLAPVQPGEPGQLAIAGRSLARCYLGDPRRTAAAFVPHPLHAGERIYLTGDRGIERPDGSFEYLDRLDRQVKIRGVRLELEEVETALRRHPEVADAVVTVWEPEPGDRRLAAYVVLAPAGEATPETLRVFLGGILPAYAVPNAVAVLDALPRLPNGKLDRRSLPAPAPGAPAGHTAPGSVTEQVIAEIWQDVLGLPRVGAHDDFFAVGGHSLLATRVVNRMRHAFDTHVPLSLLFEHPTVATQAEQVERLVATEIAAMDDDEVLSLGEGGTHVR
ncbi:AMP-binding protein [Nonomuraea antimicrobica]